MFDDQTSILIQRKSGLGGVTAWIDGDKLYIRETPRREKTQTVCLSTEELDAIVALAETASWELKND